MLRSFIWIYVIKIISRDIIPSKHYGSIARHVLDPTIVLPTQDYPYTSHSESWQQWQNRWINNDQTIHLNIRHKNNITWYHTIPACLQHCQARCRPHQCHPGPGVPGYHPQWVSGESSCHHHYHAHITSITTCTTTIVIFIISIILFINITTTDHRQFAIIIIISIVWSWSSTNHQLLDYAHQYHHHCPRDVIHHWQWLSAILYNIIPHRILTIIILRII